ncbi:rod shape-determining protein MreC [Aestuariispira ectoiniformans]|uniref:rod shape-determining protein MreC n=1 Tax=Aestuariispira ectoiniformans TaxID=2775080 RepID=UPI00223A8F12|nr:rod shape-determining protein MreC [Aestuariispira ectoiniformans]
MNQRSGAISRIATLRTLVQRFAFLLLLASAVAIMIVGRADPRVFERARTIVTDIISPMLDVLSRPTATVDRWIGDTQTMVNLYEENQRLREENLRLLQWRSVAQQLNVENTRLRNLMALKRDDARRYITGRVIGVGGSFVRSVTLNIGKNDGVRKGFAAVVGEGVVGRVAEVGHRSSRVLLLTDLNSRLPIVIESTRVRAVLAGDNSTEPHLIYLPADAALEVGQRVVTSGHGGAFPPGLPVGVVSSVGEEGVRIRLYAEMDRREYIRLMDFGLSGIINAQDDMKEDAAVTTATPQSGQQ